MTRTRVTSKLVSIVVATLLFGLLASTCAMADSDAQAKAQAQQKVRDQSSQTLARLYKESPSAKQAIASAAGYATFSNFGMKILVAGGGTGSGVAVDGHSHQETFMKMVEVQAGLGFGIKQFALVFVFENPEAFSNFVNQGWAFSGQASLSAKNGEMGGAYEGAVSVAPGIWLYQLTSRGLSADLTVKGTKYYKNTDLN
jgi:lipid-binding SYLF domain-containing protein